MSVEEYLILAIAAFFSAIIKSGVGVGSGIFLLPLLSLIFPAKIALALGAPIMFGSDLMGLRLYWKQWAPLKELCRLFIPAIPGLIIGVWLLPIIPSDTFRICIGAFGMVYALFFLFPHVRPVKCLKQIFPIPNEQGSTLTAALYGFMGGVATVLAHAGGLVWSMYLVATQKDRRIFVGTIVVMFALTNGYKTLAFLYIGLLTSAQMWQAFTTVPVIILGAWLGSWANKKVNQLLFKRVVLTTIFVTSGALVF